MAGAIDLFAGSSSISGPNLFGVDKNPLNQLDAGIEDVLGKHAANAAGQFTSALEGIIFSILGIPPDSPIAGILTGTGNSLTTFFTNFLAFAGELNPLDPNFDPQAAVNNFIQTLLKTSNMVSLLVGNANSSAGVTGFIPMENLAMDLIAGVVGGAQELIDAIMASVGYPAGSATTTQVDQYFKDLLSMLANPQLAQQGQTFNPVTAITTFITNMLHPQNMLAPMNPVTKLLAPLNIPGLDATKIVSGIMALGQIPNLPAGQITSGTFLASLIPGLDATKIISGILALGQIPNLPAGQVTSGVFGAGLIPGLDATKIVSGIFPQSMVNITSIAASIVTGVLGAPQIPGLDATKIISGIFTTGQIPNLPAGQITSGVFGAGLIPGLDASKIVSGVLATTAIPNITKAMSTDMQTIIDNIYQAMLGGSSTGNTLASVKSSLLNIPGVNIISTVLASVIPGLDATKIVSGLFGVAQIPGLDAAKIISGTFGATLIPGLDATKIVSGIFTTGQIPNLPASIITSGSFLAAQIPGLDATKIITGTFANAMSPGLLPQALWQAREIAATNLVISPGFDDSTVPRETASQSGGSWSYSTTVARSGTQSLKAQLSTLVASQNELAMMMPHTATTGFGTVNSAGIRVQPGQWFYAEAYVRAGVGNTTTAGTVNFGMYLKDSTGVNATAFPVFGTGAFMSGLSNSAWTKIGGWYQIPAGFDLIYPMLWCNGQNVASQVFYFDDVQVIENTQAQAVTQKLWGGSTILTSVLASVIPGLDASKIITGALALAQIPSLPAGQITSGIFGATLIPGLDATKIISGVFGQTQIPSLTGAWGGTITGSLINSVINATVVPGLDASKIVSGLFGVGQIPNLPAAQITSGVFGAGLIPGLDATKIITGVLGLAQIPTGSLGAGNIADIQSIIDGIYQAVHGGTGTGNLVSTVKPSLLNIPGANIISTLLASVIPGLDATKIISGVLSLVQIPSLPAGQITSGIFGAGLIPGLDATKIISGVFTTGQIPNLPASIINSGIFPAAQIPGLDATKIISGVFTQGLIPSLTGAWGGTLAGSLLTGSVAASLITGVLGATTIPGLDATKIVSGIFPQSMVNITNIPATVVSGVLAATNIPGLDTTKIISGTFANAMSPGLLPQTLWQARETGGTNLVISPAFDDSTIPRTLFNVSGPGTVFGYSTAVARSGTQCYAVTTSNLTTGQNEGYFLSSNTLGGELSHTVASALKVQPGQWFYGEVYVRAKATNTTTAGSIGINLMLRDSTSVNADIYPALGTVAMSGLSSAAWTKVSGWYQIPAGYDMAWPFASLLNANVANQTFYWDDVRIVENTQAQAVTQQLFGGSTILPSILAGVIPGLDATKIISGVFGVPQIPFLPTTQITSGVFTLPFIPSLPAGQITSGVFGATLIPGLDASKITSGQFAQSMVNLTNIPASIVSGLLAAANIPGLDATKIITGQFGVPQIPNLPAAQITSGTFVQSLIPSLTGAWGGTITGSLINSVVSAAVIPTLDATKIATGVLAVAQIPVGSLGAGNIADIQTIIDGIYQAVHGGSLTGNLASTVKPSLLNIPGANIVTTLLATVIPGLDATKIITGQFGVPQIPNLPAAQITSGTFVQSLIPSLTAGWGGTITGSLINSVINATVVPGLDASKIVTGVFTVPQIPSLPASIVTSGIFGAGQIPGLDATKIISGVFTTGLIPNLPASIITSGLFGAAQIPPLDASKITTGAFADTFVPGLISTRDAIYQAIYGGVTTGHTVAEVKTALINIPGANIVSTLLAGVIPSLDATKVTTGVFSTGLIPNLPAGIITSGIFPAAQIPGLDATKIISGIFTTGLIPGLDASKIISGAFGAGQIPGLDASKIITGTFANALSPGLLPQSLWQATSQAGSNLIIGPDFEDSTIARQVGSYNAPNDAVGSYSTAQRHGGTRSFALTTATTAGNNDSVYFGVSTFGTLFDQEVRCQAGQWFYAEIYVLAKSTNTTTAGNIYLAVVVNDSTGVNTQLAPTIQAVPMSGLSSSVWTKLSGWYQIPAGYDRLSPFVGCNSQNVGAQTFYLDDVRFIEDTQAQAVTQKLWGGSTILTSVLAAVVPALDATKITTGVFGTALIPNLPATIITSGIFGAGQIPGLDATKIISGVFANAMSPGLLPQAGGLSAASNNLVIGGDFEDSTIARTIGSNGGGIFAYSTAQKRGGAQSFAITTGTASNNDFFFLSSHTLGGESTNSSAGPIKVQPGQWFYGEFYALAKSTNTTTAGNIQLGAFMFDSTGVNATTFPVFTGALVAQSGLSSATWTKISGWYQIPAGYDRLSPMVWTNGANVVAQTFYIDDARITEATQAQNVTQKLWGGSTILTSILAGVVPGLDASKIISGTFANALSPGLLPQTTWQVSQTGAKNLVVSPNFEDSTITRDPSFGAGASVTYSTDFAHGGTQSIKMVTSNAVSGQSDTFALSPSTVGSMWGGSAASVVANGIKTQPGQWFYSEIYVRAAAANTASIGNILGAAFVKDSAGVNSQLLIALTNTVAMNAVSNSGWTKLSGWYQIPAGYDLMYPFAWAQSQNVANQTFYWDDARIVEDTQAQAVTQKLWGGSAILTSILPTAVPGLDATKIISGVLAVPQIPALDASQIQSGQFAHWLLPVIPVGSIGQTAPNLLANPTYASAASIATNTDFTWDSSVTHTADGSGSAKAVCSGAAKNLVSDPSTPVAANQVLSCSHWLQWSGVTGTGACFQLSVISYLGTNLVGSTVLQTVSNPAATGAWQQLSGTYTVPASGVDNIRLQIQVLPAATAGNTWWDDGSITKTQLLQQTWMTGAGGTMVNELATMVSDTISRALQTDLMGVVNNLGLGTFGNVGASLSAITSRLQGLPANGTVLAGFVPGLDATKIVSGAFGIAQIPTGQLGIGNITDIQTLTNYITNSLVGAGSAYSATTLPQARGSMDSIYANVINNTQAVQALQSNTVGQSISGISVNIDFGSYADGNLPSFFTVTYTGAGSSAIGVSSGVAGWSYKANDGNRQAFVIHNLTPTSSDFQIVRGTMHAAPDGSTSGGQPYMYALGRVDSPTNPRNYVFGRAYCAGFLNYKGDVGYCVGGVETVWASNIALTWSTSMAVFFGANGNPRQVQVFSGTQLVFQGVEPGTTSLYGPGYRYWGAKNTCTTGSNGMGTGGTIAGTSVSDNAPPAVLGSTFRSCRLSSTTVSVSGPAAALPANYWDTLSYISPDMSWNSGGGILTVSQAGTYTIKGGLFISNLPGNAKMNLYVSRNGGLTEVIASTFADGSFNANSANVMVGSANVYCNAGDTLQLLVSASSATTIYGDVNGTTSVFQVALANRSMA